MASTSTALRMVVMSSRSSRLMSATRKPRCPMPIDVISTSSPCLSKMPSSIATMTEAQSEVAVQPTWIFAWARTAPAAPG
jgi:hypothetical protein